MCVGETATVDSDKSSVSILPKREWGPRGKTPAERMFLALGERVALAESTWEIARVEYVAYLLVPQFEADSWCSEKHPRAFLWTCHTNCRVPPSAPDGEVEPPQMRAAVTLASVPTTPTPHTSALDSR